MILQMVCSFSLGRCLPYRAAINVHIFANTVSLFAEVGGATFGVSPSMTDMFACDFVKANFVILYCKLPQIQTFPFCTGTIRQTSYLEQDGELLWWKCSAKHGLRRL